MGSLIFFKKLLVKGPCIPVHKREQMGIRLCTTKTGFPCKCGRECWNVANPNTHSLPWEDSIESVFNVNMAKLARWRKTSILSQSLVVLGSWIKPSLSIINPFCDTDSWVVFHNGGEGFPPGIVLIQGWMAGAEISHTLKQLFKHCKNIERFMEGQLGRDGYKATRWQLYMTRPQRGRAFLPLKFRNIIRLPLESLYSECVLIL